MRAVHLASVLGACAVGAVIGATGTSALHAQTIPPLSIPSPAPGVPVPAVTTPLPTFSLPPNTTITPTTAKKILDSLGVKTSNDVDSLRSVQATTASTVIDPAIGPGIIWMLLNGQAGYYNNSSGTPQPTALSLNDEVEANLGVALHALMKDSDWATFTSGENRSSSIGTRILNRSRELAKRAGSAKKP